MSRTASVTPASAETRSRTLPKGQQTKAAIVDAALRMAAQVGLEQWH